MVFDWFAREGGIVLQWWLLVTLAGAAVLPLCMRLLGDLPDKGYTLARAVGLLLVGFVFWLLASLGFLVNSTGSIKLAWLIVLGVSLFAHFRLGDRIDYRAWWRDNKRAVIVTEVLFLVLLLAWSVFRAYQHDTFTTEKPMEMAFISGTMRSDTFPPNDPWMSGYAISYYYFGYVIAAMLSMMSGVSSAVGFSMTNALLFALTGITSFGVVYNLVRSRIFNFGGARRVEGRSPRAAILTGLLGMIFLILLSNFQLPLVELPYQSRSMPQSYFEFWGIQSRQTMPNADEQIAANPIQIRDPSQWSYWWWFRASRVLTDYQLDGTEAAFAQPIDEFPNFSFLLADNHPHVLALPFAVLALGLGLNLLLTWRDPNRYEVVFYGICLGGLVFLNTWDGPIYMVALVGVDALRRAMRDPNGRLRLSDIWGLVKLGLGIGIVAFIAYLPFFIGFRSQASGIVPNLLYPTLFRRYFIMFGPFILILGAFLAVETWRAHRQQRMNWRLGITVGGLVFLGLVGFLVLFTVLGAIIPQLREVVEGFVNQNGGWDVVIPGLVQRRLSYALTTIVLLGTIVLIVARLFPKDTDPRKLADESAGPSETVTYPPATGFVLLLVGMGVTLTLIPEFFYLRDNFGTRINTIFKFYYQAWVVFSLAGAYAVYTILADKRMPRPVLSLRAVFGVMLGLILVAGLAYPVLGVYHRMFVEHTQDGRANQYTIPPDWSDAVIRVELGQFVQEGQILISEHNGVDAKSIIAGEAGQVRTLDDNTIFIFDPVTLDGAPSMVSDDDYAALMCLSELIPDDNAVVAEVGYMAYRSRYGRVGSITGIPIVIGWVGHESQWRGPTYGEIAGSRQPDIEDLYVDLRWDVALRIIERYDIDYIFYGDTERSEFGLAGEEKFIENLPVVCTSGDTRVYEVHEHVTFEADR